MTGHKDRGPRFVCYACIGDAFLKAEIQHEEKPRVCMICGTRKRAIAFEDLCDRVHEIVSEKFRPTASEPESWEMYKDAEVDWEREGQTIDEVLYEILECNDSLVEALKQELSNQHHSFDDAAMGTEDPYGDEVHYVLSKPNDYEFHDVWSAFEREIRTRARFFSSTALSLLDEIFGDMNRFRAHDRPLIRETGPGTATEVLYRARRAFDNAEIGRIVEHPARELGAPPSRSAGSGRMNPRWISMFYGALDPDTCVAEMRAPVGGSVVIGRFKMVRKLQLLDLDVLQHLFVEKASYFDPAFWRLRDKAQFLKRLVVIMSRPVLPTDEDYQYLPTQAVAEYLSERMTPKLDGIIYPSSQRGGKGENAVLFRRASSVESDGTDDLNMETDFGWATDDDWDLDITIRTSKKRKPRKAKRGSLRLGLLEVDEPERSGDPTGWSDLAGDSGEQPALRVELDAIEVRDVRAVEYTATKRTVRRYKKPTGKLPF
jgi:hypothetical protein